MGRICFDSAADYKMPDKVADFLLVEMPEDVEVRCDACIVVVQNIAGILAYAESRKGRPLQEHHVDATMEHLCKTGFYHYDAEPFEPQEGDGRNETYHRLWGPGSQHHWKVEGDPKFGDNIWMSRLRKSCSKFVEDFEEELYSVYQKHVPATSRSTDVQAEATSEGVKALASAMCLTQAGGKKKKKTVHGIAGSCPEELFFFGQPSWKSVLTLHHKQRFDVEL